MLTKANMGYGSGIDRSHTEAIRVAIGLNIAM